MCYAATYIALGHCGAFRVKSRNVADYIIIALLRCYPGCLDLLAGFVFWRKKSRLGDTSKSGESKPDRGLSLDLRCTAGKRGK